MDDPHPILVTPCETLGGLVQRGPLPMQSSWSEGPSLCQALSSGSWITENRTASRNLDGVVRQDSVFYPGNRSPVASCLLTLVYWSGLFHGSRGTASPHLCDVQK